MVHFKKINEIGYITAPFALMGSAQISLGSDNFIGLCQTYETCLSLWFPHPSSPQFFVPNFMQYVPWLDAGTLELITNIDTSSLYLIVGLYLLTTRRFDDFFDPSPNPKKLKMFLLLESNSDGDYNTNISEDELPDATIWFPGFLMNSVGEAATGRLKLTPAKNISCDREAYASAKEKINDLISQFDNLTQSSNAITEVNNLKARVDGNLLQEAFIDCSVVLKEMLNYSSVTEQNLTTQCVVSY
jgi:hypothetical protein